MLDYIVIGSGPAGLLINGEMAKANMKGICIEKGNFIKSSTNDIYTPYQIFNGYKKSGFNILLGKPPLLLSEGHCLGGGSIVNSSLHHRTPKHIWNKWLVKFKIKNFTYNKAEELYKEIERIFSCSYGESKMPNFYKTASEKISVNRIARWGYHKKNNQFERKTALDVVRENYENSLKNIITGMEVIDIMKIKDNEYLVKCLNSNQINKKTKIHKFHAKNIFLCAGAGSTPLLLYSLGYRHKMLGKFKVHPTARISLVSSNNEKYDEVVEPFQITEYFPELMIGSSANRPFLSEINYPFKKSKRNFSNCLNLYSMAPSNQNGHTIMSGPFRGLKFYNLNKDTKERIKFGLEKIIEIACSANYSHAFSPADEIEILNAGGQATKNFIVSTINKTLSSVHIFSSAASGEVSEYCPVRSNGSIPGFKGVYVMDSSVIPSCPTVNPQATVTIFALKMIREFLKS